MKLIRSITRKITREPNEPLNIVTACTHEAFESGLALTQENFYAFRTLDGSVKNWETKYRKVPSNYTLLNPHEGWNQIPLWLDVDLVLSQNKFGQYQILS